MLKTKQNLFLCLPYMMASSFSIKVSRNSVQTAGILFSPSDLPITRVDLLKSSRAPDDSRDL